MIGTIEELISSTKTLETSVPQIKGAFSELQSIHERILSPVELATVVVGTIKAGKTTLVNSLVGHDILPRGSGVKSLNLTTVAHSETSEYKIQFREPSKVLTTLKHDFRILGHTYNWDDPYHPQFVDNLHSEFEDLKNTLKKEGRFSWDTNIAGEYNLIHTAYVRIEKIIAGMKIMMTEFPPELIKAIGSNEPIMGDLEKDREILDRCSNSAELAAVIEMITVKLPYQGKLPNSAQIIDCQGSDSLNPLDLSSVRSAFYCADEILYVVNSRLGLRKGDHELLQTIKDSKLTCPVSIAVNIEHFEPRPLSELKESVDQIKKTAEKILGRSVELYCVDALAELHQSIKTPESEMSDVLGNWQSPAREECNVYLADSYQKLCLELSNLNPTISNQSSSTSTALENKGDNSGFQRAEQSKETVVLPLLVSHAADLAKALLNRDEVIGATDSEFDESEFRGIISHIIEEHSKEIRSHFAGAIDQSFRKDGGHFEEVEKFIKSGANHFSLQNPQKKQDTEEFDPAQVYNDSVNQFLNAWLSLNLVLKEKNIPELIVKFRSDIELAIEKILKFTRNLLISNYQFNPLQAEEFVCVVQREIEESLRSVMSALPMPDFVEPVLIHDVKRHAIYAVSHSKNAWTKIIGKMRPGKNSGYSTQDLTDRCALQTYQACFSQAKSHYQLSLRSAQENYKFQFFFKIIDSLKKLMDSLMAKTLQGILDRTKRQGAVQQPLLSQKERAEITGFLSQVSSELNRV